VHDITVFGMPGVRKPAANLQGAAAGPAPDPAGDELLARLLITGWTLITGRVLRADVPPHQLSEGELISFWADDQTAASGRAAAAP
jgi:hypothetical protein